MQNRMGRIAVGACLVVMAAAVAAQEPMKPVGVSVKAGVFLPTDSNTRRGGSGWFAAGVEYKFWERPAMAAGQTDTLSVSLDYASRNNYRVVPLLVNFTRHNGPIYFTAGIGASFSRRPVATGVEDRTRLGYQVGVGYEFQTSQFPLFLEARFLGNDRAELNGLAVYAGVRF
jgi:hypothetical protein